jgi:hypothetical protein
MSSSRKKPSVSKKKPAAKKKGFEVLGAAPVTITEAGRAKIMAALGKKSPEKKKSGAALRAEITSAEAEAAASAPATDLDDAPGFTVTVMGSLPGINCAVVLKKGPIRAQNEKAAIARFMAEVGTQLKKPSVIDVEDCVIAEMAVKRSPRLPFQKSEEKKVDEKAKASTTKVGDAYTKPSEPTDPKPMFPKDAALATASTP